MSMSKLRFLVEEKYERYKKNGWKELFLNDHGAIDLASVMVGVIVIGLIGGVIAATIFAVIPWTQDNAAKQQLDSIVQAENAYFGMSTATPSPLPAGTPPNTFGDSPALANASLLVSGKTYCVVTTNNGKNYQGYSASDSGAIFTVTDAQPTASSFSGVLPTACQFIAPAPIAASSTPPPYTDPTPTLTTLTYKCAASTIVSSPYQGSLTGTEKWSDQSTGTTYSNASQLSRTLSAGVTYQVTFDGTYTSFNATTGSQSCLQSVDHWGANTKTTNAANAFANTPNLKTVDGHIPTTITNLSGAFKGDSTFNDSGVSTWDVSNVTNMNHIFDGAAAFNQPLNWWNTSKATDLSYMFNGATAFNQDITNWNTSSAASLVYMFNNASAFNQDLSSWNTGSVKGMAYVFGQPFGTGHGLNWATQNTTISYTIKCATSGTYNNPIIGSSSTGYETWSTGASTYLMGAGGNLQSPSVNAGTTYHFTWEGTLTSGAFTSTAGTYSVGCLQSVDYWGNGTGLTSLQGAFNTATNLSSVPANLPTSVTNLSNTFKGATGFNNSNLSNWDTTNVTTMTHTFDGASAFNQPLNSWNTAKVTDASFMFNGASAFNQPLNSWNTSNLSNLVFMFNGASAFNQDLSSWNTGSVKGMAYVFGQPFGTGHGLNWATQNTTISYTIKCATSGTYYSPLSSGVNNGYYTWSDGTSTLLSNTGGSLSSRTATAGVTYHFTWEGTFSNGAFTSTAGTYSVGCLQSVDYWANGSGLTSLQGAFNTATNLTSIPTNLPTGVTDLSNAFKGNTSFNNANVSNWDTTNVTNMTHTFDGASAFNQPLNSWNTAKVADASFMFNGASMFNQPLNSWNTAAVKTMLFMFNGATAFNQDLSSWNTGSVKGMAFAFGSAYGTAHGLNWATQNTTISYTIKCATSGTYYSPLSSSINNGYSTWSDGSTVLLSNSGGAVTSSHAISAGVTYHFTWEGTLNNGAFTSTAGSYSVGCLQSVDYWANGSGLTSLQGAFNTATNLVSVPANLPTGVTDISNAFKGATSFNDANVTSWDTTNVTNMNNAFNGATVFNQNIVGWNVAKVTNMSSMFLNNSTFVQDLHTWNTAALTSGTTFAPSTFPTAYLPPKTSL